MSGTVQKRQLHLRLTSFGKSWIAIQKLDWFDVSSCKGRPGDELGSFKKNDDALSFFLGDVIRSLFADATYVLSLFLYKSTSLLLFFGQLDLLMQNAPPALLRLYQLSSTRIRACWYTQFPTSSMYNVGKSSRATHNIINSITKGNVPDLCHRNMNGQP